MADPPEGFTIDQPSGLPPGFTIDQPQAPPTMQSAAQQWAKDISTVQPGQSRSMFGTPVPQRGETYGQTLSQYWDEGVRKVKEGLGSAMEATDPLKPHSPLDALRMAGGLGQAAHGAVSGAISPVTAVTNPAWEYTTGIPGEKAFEALGAAAPAEGLGALNLRPRIPSVPDINPTMPPRGSALSLPGTLQREPQIDLSEFERALAPLSAEARSSVPAAAASRPPNLLSPDIPHAMPSGRASVGAAGNPDPLAEYSPETIAKVGADLKQAFPTPHLLEQALDERSAHHMLGELDPALESKMSGLAANTGPERSEIVNSVMQRSNEAPERLRSAFDRAFGQYQDRASLGRLLEIQRNKDTDPFWDKFKSTTIPPTAPLQALTPRLNAAGALQAANKALRIEGLPQVTKWAGAGGRDIQLPTASAYQYAKEHLDDKIEAALARPGGQNEARRFTQLKNDLVNAIDNHPERGVAGLWKAARDTYAKPTQIIKAMKLGERVLTGHVSAEELPFMTASLGPDELRALQVGMRGSLEDTFGRPGPQVRKLINTVLAPSNQSKLRWAIGDAKADELIAAIEHEDTMHNAPTRLIRGSPTAERTAARQEWNAPESRLESIAGEVPGAVMHPMKTAAKAAAKTVFRRQAAEREAKAARLREEAARIYTLQGPERDAVARALIGGRDGNVLQFARARGGAVPPLSTRKDSRYSPKRGTPGRHCGADKAWPHGACAHYRKPNRCALVAGFIAAHGGCGWYDRAE
jgi:hypothetical protein